LEGEEKKKEFPLLWRGRKRRKNFPSKGGRKEERTLSKVGGLKEKRTPFKEAGLNLHLYPPPL